MGALAAITLLGCFGPKGSDGGAATAAPTEQHSRDGGSATVVRTPTPEAFGDDDVLDYPATPRGGIVGQTGGATRAVAVVGRLALVGVGARLVAFDLTTPSEPRRLWSSPLLPGIVESVAVSNDAIYVAAGSQVIVLQSELTQEAVPPRQIGAFTFTEERILVLREAEGALTVGGVGMGGETGFLALLDASDATRPRLLSRIDAVQPVSGLFFGEDHVVTDQGEVYAVDAGQGLRHRQTATTGGAVPPSGVRLVLTRGGVVTLDDAGPVIHASTARDACGIESVTVVNGRVAVLSRLCDIGTCRGGLSIEPDPSLPDTTISSALSDQIATLGDFLVTAGGLVDGVERPLAVFSLPRDLAPVAVVSGLSRSIGISLYGDDRLVSVDGQNTLSLVSRDFEAESELRHIEFEPTMGPSGLSSTSRGRGSRLYVSAGADGLLEMMGDGDALAPASDTPSELVEPGPDGLILSARPAGGFDLLGADHEVRATVTPSESGVSGVGWVADFAVVSVDTSLIAYDVSDPGDPQEVWRMGLQGLTTAFDGGPESGVVTTGCSTTTDVCAAQVAFLDAQGGGLQLRAMLRLPAELTSAVLGLTQGEVYAGTDAATGHPPGVWRLSFADGGRPGGAAFIALPAAPREILPLTASTVLVAAGEAGVYVLSFEP